MFVKLTSNDSGESLFINANLVRAVCDVDGLAYIDVGNEVDYVINESPETVAMLLNSALKGR